jgi:hypothetical protein
LRHRRRLFRLLSAAATATIDCWMRVGGASAIADCWLFFVVIVVNSRHSPSSREVTSASTTSTSMLLSTSAKWMCRVP